MWLVKQKKKKFFLSLKKKKKKKRAFFLKKRCEITPESRPSCFEKKISEELVIKQVLNIE